MSTGCDTIECILSHYNKLLIVVFEELAYECCNNEKGAKYIRESW